MPSVQTARGPVDTGSLGRVLMHEHVFVISTEIQQNYPEEWGPEDVRVDTVAKLCKRGYADRMVLSHDAACYLDWIPGELPPPTMRHWNYLHISKDVLPMQRERGVTDAQIHQMLVDNPRRYFERQGAY
jgi:predicted metal-dependent phosphotriesterase family hydrolase